MTGQQIGAASMPYLHEVTNLLWPGSIRSVRRFSWMRSGRTRRSGETTFLALPDAQRPAMLVPSGPRLVTATALREAKTGGARGRRRLLSAAATAASLGLAFLLPSRTIVLTQASSSASNLLMWLSGRLGMPVYGALSGSPARANRKPIVHLIAESGSTVGFAKVGTNDLTKTLVAAEAAALRHLAQFELPGLQVPRLMMHDRWNGLEVLVQQPLAPHGSQAITGSFLAERMVALARSGEATVTVVDGAYLSELRARVGGLTDLTTRKHLLAVLDRLTARHGGDLLELGSWHGDWTPWNMARDGQLLLVWDWERFAIGVPMGFDALHHRLQEQVVRASRPPAEVADRLVTDAGGLLAPFGVSGLMAQVSAILYLIELGTRYCADGQREAGAALSQIDDWLLPVVARQCDKLIGTAL